MNEKNKSETEDQQQTPKPELLVLKTGYHQHASPFFPNTTKNPKIQNVLIQMLKDNKIDYTINFTRKALTFLSQHTSLGEPEAVKLFIATHKASDGYKRNLCIAYNKYCKSHNITWNMPCEL